MGTEIGSGGEAREPANRLELKSLKSSTFCGPSPSFSAPLGAESEKNLNCL